MRRRSWKLGPFLIVAALALSACTPGKSYRFPSVRIDATVNPDGSLTLVEQRTYDFRGHFHFATFTVEENIGGESTQEVSNELRSLASEIGYNVRQFRVEGEGNQRIAKALISNR